MKKFFTLASIIASLAFFSACGGGGGGGGHHSAPGVTDVVLAEDLVDQLNWEAGYEKYYVAKAPSYREGYVVILEDVDGGYYHAICLDSYYQGMDLDYFFDYLYDDELVTDLEVVLDSYGYPTGDFYDGYYYYEQTSVGSKDLEKIGAFMEARKIQRTAEYLAAEFGLSEERGMEVAKLTSNFEHLSKMRSLTDADANSFAEEVIGTDMKTARAAYEKAIQGNREEIEI